MKFDVLHNFISPVTGRVLADPNYVLLGNRAGIAIPSPIIIDIRLDLMNLRKRYNTLSKADIVVGHENIELPNAQVLENLDNGFLYNTDGIVSIKPTSPKLPLCYAATTTALIATYDNGAAGIGATLTAIGPFSVDLLLPPVGSLILVKDQVVSAQNGIYVLTNAGGTDLAWILTRSTLYDQPEEIQAGDIVAVEFGTINSTTLWIQTEEVNVIGTDAILFISINLFNTLPQGNIWIGNASNRPVPNPRVSIDNLPSFRTFDPTSNFGLYNLYTGQLFGITSPLNVSQPTTTLRIDMSNMPNLSVGKMWIGVKNYTPPIITIDDIPPFVHVSGSLNWDILGLLQDSHAVPQEVGLPPKYLFIGSSDPTTINQIVSTPTIFIDNFPNLTLKRIWRGDITNRPVESDDLTTLELQVTNIEDVLIPGLEAEIAALEAEIVALQAEVLELQGQVAVLAATIAVVQGQILILQGQVAALNTRIDNLRLNNILADADISVYNFKIINLADPVNPQDAVNLRTITSLYPGTVTSVSGTAGQIDVVNPTTTPVISIDPAYVGQTSITTLGTITTGTWHGSIIPLAYGGTNANLTASNGGIFYSTASAGAILSGTATANQVLLSGSSSAPSWSTATYPATTTINQLLYSSSANTIAGLSTANNGVLVTSNTGVPSIGSTLPSAVQLNITSLGTITTGTWNASIIPLAYGGTNANLTASNGGIFYSTASAGAILSGTVTANQVLLSGASGAPQWSIATYPLSIGSRQLLYASSTNTISGLSTTTNGTLVTDNFGTPSIVGASSTNNILLSNSTGTPAWSNASYPTATTINQLLYSNSTNNIIGLATANNSVLLTNGSGVPAWQTLTSNVVTSLTGTTNQITVSASTGAVTISMPSAVVITTSVTAGNLELITNTLQSNNTNGDIIVAPNGTGNTQLIPTGSGFVGINQASPHSPLHFSNSTNSRIITLSETANNAFQFFGFGTATNMLTYNVGSTSGLHVFYAATSSSARKELARITAGGNGTTGIMGINQSSPVAGLHVVGGVQNVGSEDSVIRAESSSNQTKIEIVNTGASGHLYEVRSTSAGFFDVVDRTASAERFQIDNNGNVGIPNAPTYLLDVFGTARCQKLLGNLHAPTFSASTAAGTSPTFAVSGSEINGLFSLHTGSGATSGLIGTFTLAAAMPNSAFTIIFQAANATTAAAALQLWTSSTSTTTFTLNTQNALASNTIYLWYFIIMGY